MGYNYTCDSCNNKSEDSPPFMGEFRESFLKTDGGIFAEQYAPGQTITLCPECVGKVLL